MKWFARQRRVAGFQYSAWDGTQTGFDLDAEQLLDEMSDDLLYHGDLNAALRRLMQQAVNTPPATYEAMVYQSKSANHNL